MNVVQRFIKNIGVLFISQIVTTLFGLLILKYTATYLGVENFGVLSFSLAFSTLFIYFADLGLGPLMIRDLSRDKSRINKYLENIIPMKVLLSIFTYILIIFLINILNYPAETKYIVYIIALYTISTSFVQLFNSVFQAFQNLEYVSIGTILGSLILLIGSLILVNEKANVMYFAYLYLISGIASLIYSSFIADIKFSHLRIDFDYNFCKRYICEALPFGISNIFTTIYFYIGTTILSLMLYDSNEAIGWYNAAYKLVLSLLFIRSMIHMCIFPLMSQFYIKSHESLKIICERIFKHSLILAIPIAVGTTLLAERLILLFYNADYLPAVIALQILIWSDVFIFANFTPRLFESINKQIIFTKLSIIGAVLNILLNIALIHFYGYIGSAIATFFTEALLFIISFYIFLKMDYRFSYNFMMKTILKIAFASSVMAIYINILYNINIYILILSSGIVYSISLIMIGTIDETDKVILGKIIPIDKMHGFLKLINL